MKKTILGIIFGCLLLLTGCGNKNNDIIQKLKNKVNKLDSYNIQGLLEITNNETTYKYDIDVSYEKDEKYRVSLKNKTNDHEQIILKNSEGTYVLTPSLNKSFKFQSEWPYSNSQSYIYQTIINDIENDNNVKVKQDKDMYIIMTKVNYSNNKDLKTQKIYVDENANIKKVEVLDKNGIVKVKMTYKKVDKNPSFSDNYFKLSGNIDVNDNKVDEKGINKKEDNNKATTTSKLMDIIYPLYIPDNTKLVSQDKVNSESGDRTILTFAGDESFTIIEETVSKEDELQTIATSGELEFINDVIGNVTDNSVSFISNGVSYYAVSNTMDKAELLEVANSLNTVTVGK